MPQNSPHAGRQENASNRQLIFVVVSCLIILGFVLRMTAAVIVDRYVQQEGRQFLVEGDANGYWELGQKIASGDDYAIHQPPRAVLRVPGFPLLLAASIRAFGDNILAARFVLAIVGTACCLLTFVLGCQLLNARIGMFATAVLCVHPLQIVSSTVILSEAWFTFWMLLSLISFVSFLKQFRHSEPQPGGGVRPLDSLTSTSIGSRRKALTTGILIGAATLVRPGFLPWLGIAVLCVTGCRSRNWKARGMQTACLVFGCCLVMLPWALRNQKVTGHFVVTSLWSGPSLYDGLNPEATGASDMTFFDEEQVMAKMSEFEMNEHYKQRAVQFAIENPGRAISLGFTKAGLYLAPVPNFLKGRSTAAVVICGAFWLLLVGGGVLGAILVSIPSKNTRFFNARPTTVLIATTGPFLLFLLVHLVFVGSVRYRLPVEFPLSVLAAWGGWTIWQFFSDRQQDEAPRADERLKVETTSTD